MAKANLSDTQAPASERLGPLVHVAHGKTTLTEAITTVLRQVVRRRSEGLRPDRCGAPEENGAPAFTINTRHGSYEPKNGTTLHGRLHLHDDYVKRDMIHGAAQMGRGDPGGVRPQGRDPDDARRREHILLAATVGVLVYISCS